MRVKIYLFIYFAFCLSCDGNTTKKGDKLIGNDLNANDLNANDLNANDLNANDLNANNLDASDRMDSSPNKISNDDSTSQISDDQNNISGLQGDPIRYQVLPIERTSLDAPVEIGFKIYNDTVIFARKTIYEEFTIDNSTAEIIVESIIYTYDNAGPASNLRIGKLKLISLDRLSIDESDELLLEYSPVRKGDIITVELPPFTCEPGLYFERVRIKVTNSIYTSPFEIINTDGCFEVKDSEIRAISSTEYSQRTNPENLPPTPPTGDAGILCVSSDESF